MKEETFLIKKRPTKKATVPLLEPLRRQRLTVPSSPKVRTTPLRERRGERKSGARQRFFLFFRRDATHEREEGGSSRTLRREGCRRRAATS